MATIVSDVRDLIGEAQAAYWTDQQVYNAINEAQLEIESDVRTLVGTETITATAGSEFVDIPTTTIMIPQRVVGTNGEVWVIRQPQLEQFWSTWREAEQEDQPKFFVLYDSNRLRIWPPAKATITYTLEGITWPTEVSTTTATLAVEHELYRAILFRAAALLLETTQPLSAEEYTKISNEHVAEYKILMRRRGGHVLSAIRPSTIRQRAQIGSIKIGKRFS